MQKDAERYCLKVGFYRLQVTSLLWASQGYVKKQRHFVLSKEVAVKEWPYFLIWRKSLQVHSSPIPFKLSASASPTLGPGMCLIPQRMSPGVWEEGKTTRFLSTLVGSSMSLLPPLHILSSCPVDFSSSIRYRNNSFT